MSCEFSASKTQITKARELGIDVSDNPGYTTLGARLEAAGWDAKGKRPLVDDESLSATQALESGRHYQEWRNLSFKEKVRERKEYGRALHADDGLDEEMLDAMDHAAVGHTTYREPEPDGRAL